MEKSKEDKPPSGNGKIYGNEEHKELKNKTLLLVNTGYIKRDSSSNG